MFLNHSKKKIIHLFLTSKPYSYSDNVARAIMVCVVAGVGRDVGLLLNTSLASLFMWLFFNWYSDSRQRQPGRIVPSPVLVWTPVGFGALIAATYGLVPLFYLVAYSVTIMLYPMKAIRKEVGPLGPFLRSLTVVAHGLFLLSLTGSPLHLSHDIIAVFAVLFFVHAARNLVGDIRDIQDDRFELPAQYGFSISMWVVRGLLLAGILAGLYLEDGAFNIGLPVLVQWLSMEILARRFGCAQAHIAGYVGHRLFVLTFTFMEILIAHAYGADAALCWAMAGAAVLFNLTYSYLPGKRYPSISDIFRHSKRRPTIFKEGVSRD